MTTMRSWLKGMTAMRTPPNALSRTRVTNEQEERERDLRRVNLATLITLLLSGSAAAAVGISNGALGSVLVWSIASIAAGAATGFLFGFPRAGRPGDARPASAPKPPPTGSAAPASNERGVGVSTDKTAGEGLQPNTNLEEVSDWLTKIIVGLGLVHLKDVQNIVASISANAAAGIAATPTPSHISVSTAIIVGFAIEGFFGGYIYTRLFLQGAFSRSDQDLRSRERKAIEDVLAATPPQEPGKPTEASLPSPAQRAAASEVERAVSDNPRVAVEKMIELAREYEQLRSSMDSSPERTRLMTEIVGRMTVVALGAKSALSTFTKSPHPGDRLAAVAILKTLFDPAYITWLAERLVDDPPFVGFHAASALLAGYRLLGAADRGRLQEEVRKAQTTLKERSLVDNPRDSLIAQILKPEE